MDLDIRFLILIIVLFLSANLMLIFKRHAVATYVAIWFFVPNRADSLLGIEGIPLYSFVEIVCAIILFLIALSSTDRAHNNFEISKDSIFALNLENAIVYFFGAMVLLQNLLLTYIEVMIQPINVELSVGHIVRGFGSEFSAVMFLFSCTKLVRTKEQVESVMYVFVVAIIVLSLELATINWIPYLSSYSFNEKFNFNSILINDYDVVSMLGGVGMLSGLYFYRKHQSRYWLLVCALGLLITTISFNRSLIVSLVFGVTAFLYAEFYLNWSRVKRITLLVVVIVTIIGIYSNLERIEEMIFSHANQLISHEYGINRLQNYASLDSLYVRWGIQARAIEVIMEIFPFGTGADMLRYYMSSDIPTWLIDLSNPSVAEGYNRVTSGSVITESHNGYIEQIASYGLLGIISLVLLMSAFVRNFRILKRHKVGRTSLFSFALGITTMFFVVYLFLGYPRMYIPIFFTLHLSFLLVSWTKTQEHPQFLRN